MIPRHIIIPVYLTYLPTYYHLSYTIDKGICYLTLTDKSYPKRLAFLFLDDISREFELDLQAEYGDE